MDFGALRAADARHCTWNINPFYINDLAVMLHMLLEKKKKKNQCGNWTCGQRRGNVGWFNAGGGSATLAVLMFCPVIHVFHRRYESCRTTLLYIFYFIYALKSAFSDNHFIFMLRHCNIALALLNIFGICQHILNSVHHCKKLITGAKYSWYTNSTVYM